jgi:hypothetical protein
MWVNTGTDGRNERYGRVMKGLIISNEAEIPRAA